MFTKQQNQHFETADGSPKRSLIMARLAGIVVMAAVSMILASSAAVHGQDLYIQSITTNPTNPAINQEFDITVEVYNQGPNAAGPFYLTIHSELQSPPTSMCERWEDWCHFDGLSAGQTGVYTFQNFYYTTVGAHTIWAHVDACEDVTEYGIFPEANNLTSKSIQVGPDLIVESITPSVTSPQIGVPFTMTVTLRNQGAAAGQSYLIVDRDLATAPTEECDGELYENIAGLAAGATTTKSFQVTYSTVGPHTFWARADGCGAVEESNEWNNRSSRTMTAGIPDLVVESITPSVASPALGAPFTMTVTLRNQGTGAAGPFILLIDRDRATAPTLECAGELSENIAGLAAGATTTRSFQVTYTTCGSHTFWARVDGCGGIVESNESNNRSSRAMTVIGPDLVVDSISAPPSFLWLNTNLTMSAVIRNAGSVASSACVVQVFSNRATAPTLGCSGDQSVILGSIEPQATRTISFTVNYNTTGDKRLWVWADGCRIVSECDENNNQRSVTIRSRRGPNLVITSITPTDSPVRQFNSTSVDVVVRNIGDVATPTGSVIRVHGYSNSSIAPTCSSFDRMSTSTGSLAVGATRTLRLTDITYALWGNHTFQARVDPCDSIRESSGSDNTLDRVIDVHLPF